MRNVCLYTFWFCGLCISSGCAPPPDNGDNAVVLENIFPDSVQASCYIQPQENYFGDSYHPDCLFDGYDSTAWIYPDSLQGRIRIFLGEHDTITRLSISVKNGYNLSESYYSTYGRARTIIVSEAYGPLDTILLADTSSYQSFILTVPHYRSLEWLELNIKNSYAGSGTKDIAVSEISLAADGADKNKNSINRNALVLRAADRKHAADSINRIHPARSRVVRVIQW
jgi:hypothetical protein